MNVDAKTPTRDRLRAWIDASPYNYGAFADAIGVHLNTLSRIMRGETERPNARTMHQIEVRTGNAIRSADWFDD